MHIAVFLQHYHTPDCPTAARPYALIERLSRDHEVTLITTRAWEDKRLDYRFPWAPSGVQHVRFDVPYDNSMSPRQRLGAFCQYATRAVIHGLQMPRPDVIVGSSTPLTAAAAAATVAHLRGVPWVFEVRDLWPDFPIQMGGVPSGLQQPLYWLEKTLYRSASHIVTLSTDMEQHVQTVAFSSSVATIEYGTDLDLMEATSEEQIASLRRELSLDRRFLVLYAGTFGRANAIPTLLATARQLSDRSDALFAFAGRGYHEPLVRDTARRHDHIRWIPPRPYPETLALFRLADLSLVPFIDLPVLTTNSPSKLYDSLGAGTPVIVTNPGWTKRLVEKHRCGWFTPITRPKQLSKRIADLLDAPEHLQRAGTRAAALARKRFDRPTHMQRLQSIIESVASDA